MSNNVFANMMEVSCKAAAGKTIAAMPDVCMTPPQTPATPPGVPVPYPNTGMASDASDGSTSVKIGDQEVMLKNKSCFKKSSGDEAGSAPMKGVVTHKNMGKVYFNMWSMDVKVEGENVVRHLDITTHNHGSVPGNSPPMPHTDDMSPGAPPCTEDCDSAGPCSGSPVSILSGNKFLLGEEDVDFILEGPLPLQWQRSYRSGNAHVGWLGRGWCSPLEVSLHAIVDAQGQLVERLDCIDQSGRRIAFEPLAKGSAFRHLQNQVTLSRDEEGLYALSNGEGITYRFLPRVGAVHRLAAVSDRHGNQVRLAYHELEGHLAQVRVLCSGGQELALSFEAGRLVAVDRLTRRTEGTTATTLTRYRYDDKGALTAVIDQAGRVRRRFSYDERGLMNWQQFAGTFEAWYEYADERAGARVVSQRDNCGRAWTYDYFDDRTVVRDQDGFVTTYIIDKNRRWVGTVDAMGRFSARGVDRQGNVRALVDPRDRATMIAYDERGNPVEITDALGRTTTLEWHDELDLPVSVVDPLNRKTAYAYDERGRLNAMVDAAGHETRWEHDERGLVTAIHDALGGTSRLRYNAQAQVVAHTDCSGNETRYEYDGDGLLTAIVNAMGARTTLHHDVLGRVVRHELADGAFEAYGYDEADRIVTVENGLGACTRYVYAPDGLVTERHDACGGTVRYDHDNARRLIKLTNENGAVYAFAYDPLGRKIQETRFDGSCIRYRYDEAGGLLETIEAPESANPIRTFYRTDALGRVVQSETAHTQCHVDYDEAGQLVRARRDAVEVQLAHDEMGRVIEERLTAPGHAHVIRHAYDALGNRLETVLPGGTTIGALHYGSGHVHQIMLDGEPLADIVRDRLHRQIERTQGGLTVSWSYDAAGRPLSRVVAGLQGDAAIDRHCAHDIAGRLVSATMGARQHRYQFDALDRLTGFDTRRFDFDPAHNLLPPGQREPLLDNRARHGTRGGYRHDVHGRVVEKQIDARTTLHLAWDEQHRLAASLRAGPQGQVRTRYFYDAFGRRVAKQNDHGTVWFAWDGDRLVGEFGPDVERLFIYEPDTYMPLAQVAKAVSPQQGPAAVAVYFYHCEDNGLPVAMTDAKGHLCWQATATAWGTLTDQWWAHEPPDGQAGSARPRAEPCLRFMGQYADEESGLHYNRHRYADPDIAAFLSHDPLGLWASENTRAYPANPLQLVDPLGLVIVYHYTTKAGFNAITSGKVYQFKASKPSKEGKPKGVYVSPLGPQDLCAKDYKAKLGVTREKSEYYIAFDVDPAKLRAIPGGRGAHVLYAPEDLAINRENVVGQGVTPKKKC